MRAGSARADRRVPTHIRKNDTVLVIAGKERGKTGLGLLAVLLAILTGVGLFTFVMWAAYVPLYEMAGTIQ